MAKNGQSAALSLSESQKQVIISGLLGDGCITTTNSNSTYFVTNCKYEEYIDYKSNLLGNLFKNKRLQEVNGYCKTPIYVVRSKSLNELKLYREMPIDK